MTQVDPLVEFFIEDTWTDVSTYVRYDPPMVIRNGISNEGGTADPASCEFILDNTDGRFTPRNTAGAYYPWIKRNMPVRVSVDAVTRFFGYLSDLPIAWSLNEAVATVSVTANGVMRRLARANDLRSTLRTGLLSIASSGDIVGYWPVEDLPGSTVIASALPDNSPGEVNGAPSFAAVDPGVMSFPVATWEDSGASFFTAGASNNGGWTLGVLVVFPPAGTLTGGEELVRLDGDGTAASWRLIYSPSGGGSILIQVISSANVEILADATAVAGLDGTTQFLKLEVDNVGANVDYFLQSYPGDADAGTIVGAQVGTPRSSYIGNGIIALPDSVGIGHLVVGDTNTALLTLGLDAALVAYAGETPAQRCARLETETGIDIAPPFTGDSETLLGPQPDGTLLEILRDMEKADAGGMLGDARTRAGLTYTSRSARYNDEVPLITLNYATGRVSAPLLPTDDDQQLRNDVTITRSGGSSARRVLESGELSVQDYPDGAGRYPFADTLNVYSDDQLGYTADWVLALGTIDEARWPQVTIDLVRNPSLVAAWDDMRPGGRVRIENLPTLAGVTDVALQMIGWTETISTTHRTVTMNCVPGEIWGAGDTGIFQLDDSVFGELDVNRLGL